MMKDAKLAEMERRVMALEQRLERLARAVDELPPSELRDQLRSALREHEHS